MKCVWDQGFDLNPNVKQYYPDFEHSHNCWDLWNDDCRLFWDCPEDCPYCGKKIEVKNEKY